MIDECKKVVIEIRQMEASLDDSRPRRKNSNGESIKITYPLMECLETLKKKHSQVQRLRQERVDHVQSELMPVYKVIDIWGALLTLITELVEALESYSSHLEPSFVKVPLPSTEPNASIPLNFDLSPSYMDRLDAEFTRVYEEYTRRLATVETLGDEIIQLWAELGTPQAQQDTAIIKYYREAPEQLGLHQEDIQILQGKHDKLSEEKRNREKKLQQLRSTVETLWEKLGIPEEETKDFLSQNRGCGMRQINEFEDELERLNEVKRQNLHIFIEDARVKLQELWDALYFSEDEMLDFTPAFSDVHSDALLEAHEREIARLEALKEQRAPILSLIEKHKALIKDRDDLVASSQDASRLMLRGQKGEKRDPGKLLREEKMRKRVAKELPKVTAEVKKALEQWEEEYDRPFLVYGEPYVDEVELEDAKKPTQRSRTPAGPPPASARSLLKSASASTMRPATTSKVSAAPHTLTRTPTTGSIYNLGNKSQPMFSKSDIQRSNSSPTRGPVARVPLSKMKDGNNSPERTKRPIGGSVRIPPPKMRELRSVASLETPMNPYKSVGLNHSIIRAVDPEDVYDDRTQSAKKGRPDSNMSHSRQNSFLDEDYEDHYSSVRGVPGYPRPSARHLSSTSTTSTVVTGSENWETYDDNSEPEEDTSDTYFAKLRALRGKRAEPEQGHRPTSSSAKRTRGVPAAHDAAPVTTDQDGNRIISGSEWTDESAY